MGEDTATDHEQQVRRAAGGDVKAFLDLTRRFQHFAFGSAPALVNDFWRDRLPMTERAHPCSQWRKLGLI